VLYFEKFVNDGKKSPHILNASSNLLGFSLIIITSLKIKNQPQYVFGRICRLPVSFLPAVVSFPFWL
jgi:hypothetical protein